MNQHLQDDRTGPARPTYEGRPLARPEEDLEDQGAGFDLGTLLTRRHVLGFVGVGVGAAALAACGADDTTTVSNSSGSDTSAGEIPEETNGPYPADGTADVNVLTESGIVRQDITTSLDGGASVDGVPLTMSFTLTDMANDAAFEGAAVYAWQCDAQGRYSMYTEGVEDETWLRGIQVADANGAVSFTTIVPGCYSGRWPHIHFEVYPDVDSATDVENVIATSQVALPEDILDAIYELDSYPGSAENLAQVGSITDDMIFADSIDLQLPTVTGTIKSGYAAQLAVGVDTTTEPQAGGGEPGGPGGGPDGGGPGGEMPDGEPPSGEPPSSN